MTTKDAAAYLGIKVGTLHGWTCHRRVAYLKVGKSKFFLTEDLDKVFKRIEAVV